MPTAPKRLGATDFKFGMQVFRDNNTDMTPNIFLWKSVVRVVLPLIFPTHRCLRPLLGEPLRMSDEIWRQKTRIVGLPDGEEIMTLAFFVLTQYRHVTGRRIDGRTRCDHYYPC